LRHDLPKFRLTDPDISVGLGTMLKDGHFPEAKQYAVNSEAAFDQAYKEFGLPPRKLI
jgi:hypothetical protein